MGLIKNILRNDFILNWLGCNTNATSYMFQIPVAELLITFLDWMCNIIPIKNITSKFDSGIPIIPITFPNNIAKGIFIRVLTMYKYNCNLILLIPFKKKQLRVIQQVAITYKDIMKEREKGTCTLSFNHSL